MLWRITSVVGILPEADNLKVNLYCSIVHISSLRKQSEACPELLVKGTTLLVFDTF